MSELFVHNPKPKKPYSPRRKNDFYPTPYGCAVASVRWLYDQLGMRPKRVLDPGAGLGVWGRAVHEVYGDEVIVDGLDIDPQFVNPGDYNAWHTTDFTDYSTMDTFLDYDLVIGNPPYIRAEQFVNRALRCVNRAKYSHKFWVIGFLLKINFLGSQSRGAGLFTDNPPSHVVVYSRRPSFSGDGHTDGAEYAFIVWSNYTEWARWFRDVDFDEGTKLDWLDWDYTEEDRRK